MLGLVWFMACAAPPEDAVLLAQRRLVHSAETALLLRQAESGLASGDPELAARAVAMGLEVAPEPFLPLLDRLRMQAPPGTMAEVWKGIDPERSHRLALEAKRLEVIGSYDTQALPQRLSGINRALGHAVLDGVRAEYVVDLSEDDLRDGALERLGWVAEALGLDAPSGGATAESVIDAAIDRGITEPIAVHEGVTGALAALDPYTRAVWPAEIAAWTQHHEGVSHGVGIELADEAPVVRHLVVDGPAWKAGLHQGDLLVAVDGTPVLDSPTAAADLTGPPGTEVTVRLQRSSVGMTVTIARDAVAETTVTGYRRTAGNGWQLGPTPQSTLMVVRISAFRPSTDEAFDALLADASPSGILLDLRGNPGGDVMAAANIADRFIVDGLVADLVGRTVTPPSLEEGEVSWNTALPGHALEGVPVVVLIDRSTASAAELLAGALRARVDARLVGESTMGKAGSQGLRAHPELPVAWNVTTAQWTLPNGTSLAGGLEPDVVVSLSPAERYLTTVERTVREHPTAHVDGSPMRYSGARGRPELPRMSADPQLHRGLQVLRALVTE